MSKYLEIANILRDRIIEGEYSAESYLPFHKDLSKEFKVSRMTIQNAVKVLISEGLVITKRGMGTKILSKSVIEESMSNSDENSFCELAGTNNYEKNILAFDCKFPDKNLQSVLGLREEEPVYDILRLHIFQDLAIKLERVVVPIKFASKLTKAILEHSINEYFSNVLDFEIYGVKKIIRADVASEDDCIFLDCATNEPVLKIEEITYYGEGLPLFYTCYESKYNSSKYSFFELKRK